MKKSLVATIVLVLVIVGAAVLVLRPDKKSANNTSSSTSNTTSNTNTAAPTANNSDSSSTNGDVKSAVTITYGSNGFSPDSVTVKSGGTVTVKNDSSDLVQFDSNPHPEHTDDPELNVGIIQPGESRTITVTTTGSHGYHNHLDQSQTGIVIVK